MDTTVLLYTDVLLCASELLHTDVLLHIYLLLYTAAFAKLSLAQSNFNSFGWAELRKVPRRKLQYGYWSNLDGWFVGPSLTDDYCPSG